MRLTRILVLLIATCIVFYACEKLPLEGDTDLNVWLTDAPVDAEEVNIEIKEVQAFIPTTNTWKTLNTNAGIYNLLAYQNGKDTLLATGKVAITYTVGELKFVLGDNNSIKVNGQLLPLELNTGVNKDLTIGINKRMEKEKERITIDFDAAMSIVETVPGVYKLQPVLKVK